MARVKICESGHENPPDELYCGAPDCGMSLFDVVPTERFSPDLPTQQPAACPASDASRTDLPGAAGRSEARRAMLAFTWGAVEISGSLNVGRDEAFSPLAARLAEYDTVSRRHARLYFQDSALFVQHLGTTNPTYVNGRPLSKDEEFRLAAGDVVKFSQAVVARVELGRLA